MKLTGKTKEAFLDYYWETKIKPLNFPICKKYDLEAFFDTISELFQNALIIEFFDSVGIVITPDIARLSDDDYGFTATIWSNGFRRFDNIDDYNARPEATNAAIEKANEIFNLNNK